MSTEKKEKHEIDGSVKDKGLAMCEILTEWRVGDGFCNEDLFDVEREVGPT